MTPEFWAIIGVGLVIVAMLGKVIDKLDEVNRRLQNFWEDIIDQRRGDDDF